MRVEALDYDLPEELIAQEPLLERDASRLLVLDRGTGRREHRRFSELAELLPARSLLVANDSRVIPARLVGERPTGGRAELLLVRRLGPPGEEETWLCLGRPGKRLRPGVALGFGPIEAVVEGAEGDLLRVRLRAAGGVRAALDAVGRVPLPPYIRREAAAADRDRYQTLHATREGSVAAPTAGLHLTPRLRARLEEAGHLWASVTLHVGPGTFLPVRTEELRDHRMHGEEIEIGEAAAAAIDRARAEGRPVVAVGTTVVRALESAAVERGRVEPCRKMTELFILPGHELRVVDGLVTNFHLPRSTLLALVCALAGREAVLAAYAEAVAARYRFYSYGDAMLIR